MMELETAASAATKMLLLPGIVGLVLGWMLIRLERRAPTLCWRLTLGLGGVGVLSLVWFIAAYVGFAPASAKERELVAFVRAAFSDQHAVLAELRVADDALYLSKGDVQRIANAALRK